MAKKHRINFGDLVHVSGYGNIPFYVDGWQEIKIYEPDGVFHEKIYDITNAHTGEYEIAYDEDVTKICDASGVEEYLRKSTEASRQIGEGVQAMLFTFFSGDDFFGDYFRKLEEEIKPKKTKGQRIDELLDEYNDIKRIIDEFGDDEENDYSEKLAEIERKINEAMEDEK